MTARPPDPGVTPPASIACSRRAAGGRAGRWRSSTSTAARPAAARSSASPPGSRGGTTSARLDEAGTRRRRPWPGENPGSASSTRPTTPGRSAGSGRMRSWRSSAGAGWAWSSRRSTRRCNRFVAIKVLAPELAAGRRGPAAVRPRGPGRRGGRPRPRRRDPRGRRRRAALPTSSCSTSPGRSLQERIDRDRAARDRARSCGSACRRPPGWPRPTPRGWSTATSSRRTSCWRTASSGSRSPTSAWPAPSTTRA